eukprot:gene5310-5346_t
MLVATKTCSAVAPWCAVVEGAVCLLAGLPDPAKAAAAILDTWPSHDESTPGYDTPGPVFPSDADLPQPCAYERASTTGVPLCICPWCIPSPHAPSCMTGPSRFSLGLLAPRWPFLHDWAQARVQASRGEA